MGRLLANLVLFLLLSLFAATSALLALNTDPGKRLVIRGVEGLSGGQVVATGLSGTLPFAPRLERLELRDDRGAWLIIEGAAIAIDARRLLHGELAVRSLDADRVTLLRLPEPSSGAGVSLRLPLALSVAQLAIRELDLAQALPGTPRLAIEGSGSVSGAGDGELRLAIDARERPDRYRLQAAVAGGQIRAGLMIRETPGGLIESLARAAGATPPENLGAWALDAGALGPLDALTLNAALDAGPLQAAAHGVLDLSASSITRLQLAAELPAMALERSGQPRVAWEQVALDAELSGTLHAPRGSASLSARGIEVGAVGLGDLTATGFGDGQRVRFAADLAGLRTPLDLPKSASSVPLQVAGELIADDPAIPLRIGVQHPLLGLVAALELHDRTGRASLSLPDLTAFSDLAGTPLAGSAEIALSGGAQEPSWLQATGEVRLTTGPNPLPRLLGPAARLGASVKREGPGWRIESARIDGEKLQARVQGTVAEDRLALGWELELPDLAVLVPNREGRVQAVGGIAGPMIAPELVADVTALSGQDQLDGRVDARLAAPEATADLTGRWAGQPVRVQLAVNRSRDGELAFSLGDSRWASITASGDLRLPVGATLPNGEIRFNAEQLSDLAPLIPGLHPGDPTEPTLAGRLAGRLTLTNAGVALVQAEGERLRLPGGTRVGALQLNARVTEPLGRADTDATIRLSRLEIEPISGDLTLTARGPIGALGLSVDSTLGTPVGSVTASAAAQLDGPARRLTLQRLDTQALDQTLRLAAPAVLDLADGLAVDRLRLNLTQGSIEIAGRMTPVLDLDAKLTKVPLELIRLAAPELPLAGSLGAQIRLGGSLNAPTGSVRAEAKEVRLTDGAWRSLPAGLVTLSADLGPRGAEIDARARIASRADLQVRGSVVGTPLAPGTLALKTDGRIDLALLDPLLAGGGRQLRGQARLDAKVAGTRAAPRIEGRLSLADGAFWDRRLGLALTEIQGQLGLSGDQLRVERLTARAGPGTLALEGEVGVLAPGLPLDFRLVARNASPIQSDLASVQGDADLRLQGRAADLLTASGNIRLSRAEIRLPEQLPTTVAVLEVRERGTRARPPRSAAGAAGPRWTPKVGLDLTLTAPRAVYVRGRGIDAELGGEVRLRGTLGAPELSGGFDLLRGEYELVGQTLRFNRGRLGFDGAAGFDPSLDLEARVTAAGSTAILNVLGTATAPRIELRGEPELPEDEVLSRLLFGLAGGRLSGPQAVRLGMAAASLAGIQTGDGGLGVLDQARTGLGLDRLTIGSDEEGYATLEGGRYLSERVYLGARQGTRAGETQGVLRIEVSPRVKLEADVGSAGGTRGGAAFEHEY